MPAHLLDVDPRDLWHNPWNTNVVSPENEAKLDASLKRLEVFKPILVRELPSGKLEILGGEHRRDSAIRIGLPTVPVFNLGAIDDQKAKEISLADNSRYGTDDILQLAALLEGFEDKHSIQDFLPYTETDLSAIFSSSDIALEALALEGNPEPATEKDASRERPAKTHTIMRFKVPVGDGEKIAELLKKVQHEQNFLLADDLTNAGDALIHLLLGGESAHDD